MTTVADLLDSAADLDRLDAEVLLAESAGRNRAWLIAHRDDPVPESAVRRFQDWINRRRAGEPVAYLTGWRDFWSLRLRVTPDTLIPRPETEHLVEQALALLPKQAPVRVLDLGTGSGAIALALASERPHWQVTAVDASLPAVVVARHNARRLGLKLQIVHGHWYEPLGQERFDCVISNPPYVAGTDPHLDQGDCAWEPRIALTPGGDGLGAYRQILAGLANHLAPGGWLVVEQGFDQQTELRLLFEQAGLTGIAVTDDLAGIPRVMAGRRTARAIRDNR